ncbi:hypothetical protein [Deinococcus piscis]|nr:hypothetical protein [Deinococcus piscis]
MTQRDAELPTEQGGLPNEHTPGRTEATGQGPVQELASGELLISGVNTGPDREERESRTPTEERARLSLRGEERDPDALADRGD